MKLFLIPVFFLLTTAPATAQWFEEIKLVPGDLMPGDAAGRAVAVSGDTVLVGVPLHDGVAVDAGAAYVYVRSGTSWVQQAKLRALDGAAGDHFGHAVAIDGDIALVSAPEHAAPKGAVYVFHRTGTTWSEEAKLMLSVSDPGDFGAVVALDGDTAAIGAYKASLCGEYVYLYVRSGSTWSLQQVVAGGGFYDFFACDFDLDGDRLVVGEMLHDDIFEDNVGAAYVYERTAGVWSYRAQLLGQIVTNFRFGTNVAVSGDVILVGTGEYNLNAYVFAGSGPTWSIHQIFPYPVDDLDLDGGVGLLGDDSWSASSLYIARVIWMTSSTWSHLHTLGGYGKSGSSAIDGGTVVIGNPEDDDGGTDAGAAHVVTFEPGVGFCFGDPGFGTPCPCNNDNDGSVPGSGCDNGVFASGAKLAARGIASVSHDSVVLYTERTEPNNSGLYFQADNQVNGGAGLVFGDGLRCAGGQLVRLQVRFSDAAGYSATTVAIAAKGGIAAGDVKRYQCWYRNQSTPACGLGVNEFNLSNGYEIQWGP